MALVPGLANADACIKCGVCQLACPVLEVDPAFGGPKVLGPDWYRRWEAGEHTLDETAWRCTFCQLCEATCPVGVPVAHLIAFHKRQLAHPGLHALRDAVLVRPDLLARAPWLTSVPQVLATLAGLAGDTRWPRPRPPRPAQAPPRQARRRVGIFVDCFSRGFDGEAVEALVGILASHAIEGVLVPSASVCCGASAWASGQPNVARGRGERARRRLEEASAELEVILALNATCQATIVDEWPRWLGSPSRTPIVGAVDWLLEHELLPSVPLGSQGALALHTTCRAQVAGEGGADAEALARVGYAVAPTDLSCCGAAGSYAFKREHAERARAIGTRAAKPRGVHGVAVDSATCALHLSQLWNLRAAHPVLWIDEAMRRGAA